MDVDTFTKAAESLEYFPGMVGIMGGEPTMHPEFAELMAIFKKIIPQVFPIILVIQLIIPVPI